MRAVSDFHLLDVARPRIEALESRRLLSGGKSPKARELIEAVITTLVTEYEVALEAPKTESPAPEAPLQPTGEPIEQPIGGSEAVAPIDDIRPDVIDVVEVEPVVSEPSPMDELPSEGPLPGEEASSGEEMFPPVQAEPDLGESADGEIVGVIDVLPELPVVPGTDVVTVIPENESGGFASETGDVLEDAPILDDGPFGQEPIGEVVEVEAPGESTDEMATVPVEPVELATPTASEIVAPPAHEPDTAAVSTSPPSRSFDAHSRQDFEDDSNRADPPSRQIATPTPAREVMPAVTLVAGATSATETSTPLAGEPSAAPVEPTGEVKKTAQSESGSSQEAAQKPAARQDSAPASPSPAAPVSPAAGQADTPIADALVDVQPVVNGEDALVADVTHPVLGKMLKNGYGRVAGNDEEPPKQEAKQAPRIIKQEVEPASDDDAVVVAEPTEMQAELAANTEATEHAAADGAAEEIALATPVPMDLAEPEQLPPPVAASMVTPAEAASSAVRNVIAALAVGTAVGLVQLHQWRKRKMAEAASKLASLLSFDPLAVWLDEDDRQRNR